MKRIRYIWCLLTAMTCLTACVRHAEGRPAGGYAGVTGSVETAGTEQTDKEDGAKAGSNTGGEIREIAEENMEKVYISVEGREFSVLLYDNAAAEEFSGLLPLTLDMSELHGNEKYYNLPAALSENAVVPESIHTGDLMLYGSDCLVLFYEDFPTSFSYTPLGAVEDTAGLEEALGRGSVKVTFQITEQ